MVLKNAQRHKEQMLNMKIKLHESEENYQKLNFGSLKKNIRVKMEEEKMRKKLCRKWVA